MRCAFPLVVVGRIRRFSPLLAAMFFCVLQFWGCKEDSGIAASPVPDLSGGIAVAGGKYTVTPMSNLGNGVSVIAVINDVCNLFLVFS